MNCPACKRPVAVARAQCLYCGAPLSAEGLQEATQAARRVIESKGLAHLEVAARGHGPDWRPRRYLVLDTASAPPEAIARACSVSLWDARQWQASSRYRLIRVTTDPPFSQMESEAAASSVRLLSVSEEEVERLRTPILVETLEVREDLLRLALRDDEEKPARRHDLEPAAIALIVSGPIRRERSKEPGSSKIRSDGRMEEVFLVHLHVRGETRPWEIHPHRSGFEGPGLASAHMRMTLLVRRLSQTVPHDQDFKNLVPAFSPGEDPSADLKDFSGPKRRGKEPKVVVLDNLPQFREYSAWRGAIELVPRAGVGGES